MVSMYLGSAGMCPTPELSDVASVPEDVVVRRMVALFDYDPWESSPNMDSEVSTRIYYPGHIIQNTCQSFVIHTFLLFQAELGFRSGDIIYVLGDMDQDGFYYVSVACSFTIE